MLKVARKALLDGTGNKLTVDQFRQNWGLRVPPAGMLGDGYMAFCGCYAIATYSSAVKKGDFCNLRTFTSVSQKTWAK